MLVRARRTGVPVAALFIDLDNFKDSNDSLGHGAGDQLLQLVAGRLLGILRSGDTVGRLGGDEFVILAEGVSFASGPEMIAERVHQVLKPAFHLPGTEGMSISISASIGIAVGDRPSAEDLLRTRTSPSTGPRGAGREPIRPLRARHAIGRRRSGSPSSQTSNRHLTTANSRCSSIRSSTLTGSRSRPSNHSSGGSTPPRAPSRRMSSSRCSRREG